MTKYILIILLFLSVGFNACKKENTTKVQTTQEKLVGKWNLVSDLSNDYYSGTSHFYTYPFPLGDYMEFKSDGKYIEFKSGSLSTYDYGMVNDSQIWLDYPGNVYDLKSLTTTGLQLYHKDVFSSTEYHESTLSLIKWSKSNGPCNLRTNCLALINKNNELSSGKAGIYLNIGFQKQQKYFYFNALLGARFFGQIYNNSNSFLDVVQAGVTIGRAF